MKLWNVEQYFQISSNDRSTISFIRIDFVDKIREIRSRINVEKFPLAAHLPPLWVLTKERGESLISRFKFLSTPFLPPMRDRKKDRDSKQIDGEKGRFCRIVSFYIIYESMKKKLIINPAYIYQSKFSREKPHPCSRKKRQLFESINSPPFHSFSNR